MREGLSQNDSKNTGKLFLPYVTHFTIRMIKISEANVQSLHVLWRFVNKWYVLRVALISSWL